MVESVYAQLLEKVRRRVLPPKETLEGYDQPELVDVIFKKTLAYEAEHDWPEMADVSSVLDFGWGCGLHYKLAYRQSPGVRWAVVESPAMLKKAIELSTDNLRFFSDIPSAAKAL